MMYGMMQYGGIIAQQDLDLYYSGMHHPGTSMLPVPLNHGACNHFQTPGFYIGGFLVDLYNSGRNRHLVDDVRGPYKTKVEGNAGTFQYYNASSNSSSSVAPQHPRHLDGIAMVGTASLSLPQYRVSNTASPMEVGPQFNVWAMPGDPLILPDNNCMIQGNYFGQYLQPAPGPWQQLSSHDIDGHNVAWNHFSMPYIQATNLNRSPLESGNVGWPRYQEATINSGGPRFLPPPHPFPIYPSFHHGYHMHGGRLQNVNFLPCVIPSLYGIPMYGSTVIPAQNGFEMGPQQPRPVSSGGIRSFHPQTNGAMHETNVNRCNVPRLRLLPSEEVAILELQDNDENGELVEDNDENGELVEDNDENGELVEDNDENGELVEDNDENGELVEDNDENGELVEDNNENRELVEDNNENRELVEDSDENAELDEDSDENEELVDHHSDMRLNVDDMSYEELLELGEVMGHVKTGLSKKTIWRRLKTKTYFAPANDDQEHDSCIICQEEYRNGEKIGLLGCGHSYHVNCLKKWLLVKNVCPICKSEALTTTGKKDRHHK